MDDVKDILLMLHRYLYPEDHVGYWKTQPKEDWPYGWDGPGDVLEWDSSTIEFAAEGITDAVAAAGLPIRED